MRQRVYALIFFGLYIHKVKIGSIGRRADVDTVIKIGRNETIINKFF